MIKLIYLHWGPHFEELFDVLVFLFTTSKKYSRAAHVQIKYLINSNEVPEPPNGIKLSECIFFGIADKLKPALMAAGVPEDQIVDEHVSNNRGSRIILPGISIEIGRCADSSFRKLLDLLGLSEHWLLKKWADALGAKDSGKSGDNFTIYRTLDALYCEERQRGGCEESMSWALEIGQAALETEDYFVKGDRTMMAGKFFERVACVWACCRFSKMTKREAMEIFFFQGWEKFPCSFPSTLIKLRQAENPTLWEICRMTQEGGLRSLGVLGLPRLLYALYQKTNLNHAATYLFRALDAERLSQEKFVEAVKIVKEAKQISLGDGSSFALIVQNDNPHINKAARFVFQEQVAVIYQEGGIPKKSIQIFSNGKTGVSLSRLYQAILVEEARRENELHKSSPEKWHYLTGKSDTLLNGSGSYPGVPSSSIMTGWFEEGIPRYVDFPQQAAKTRAA